jgi:hypothetical protein
VGAILARSPADWQPSKATPGVERGTWIVELLDDSGQLMTTVIVGEEASKRRANRKGWGKHGKHAEFH